MPNSPFNRHAASGRLEAPRALTRQGALRGRWTDRELGIALFAGIPYAQAPTGDLRWRPPQSPKPWDGEREATEFGPRCPQLLEPEAAYLESMVRGQGHDPRTLEDLLKDLRAVSPSRSSEDCLYLNVRTGNLSGAAAQPVMVWIHGGSHQNGGGCGQSYQTDALVRRDVLIVTVNYRLNIFGYFAHPALSDESEWGSSGNYGLLDLIASLQWVKSNIASFGGDPDNVTVFGVSAGGHSISELMASPLAEGLFHRAILQSGVYSFDHRAIDDEAGRRFIVDAGLARPDADVKALRNLSTDSLLEALRNRPPETGNFMPGADGHVLPTTVGKAIMHGRAARISVITGYCADEGSLLHSIMTGPALELINNEVDLAQRRAHFDNYYGDDAKSLAALYEFADFGDWRAWESAMLGDELFGVHARYLARRCAEQGYPSYLYFFARTPPGPHDHAGAYHAADIAFVFDSHSSLFAQTAFDADLTERMVLYWTNFAKTGDPNGPGLEHWPAYDGSDPWMVLDNRIRVEHRLRGEKLDLLEAKLITNIAGAQVPRAGFMTDFGLSQTSR